MAARKCGVSKGWGHWRGLAAAALMVTALVGCAGTSTDGTTEPPSFLDGVMSMDLAARKQEPVRGIAQSGRDSRVPQGEIYLGSNATSSTADRPTIGAGVGAAPAGGDSFDLNFENADVTTVAKVLLGDVLKVDYLVDPRVEGTISLSSARPIPRKDILPLLENALQLNGAVVARQGDVYQIVLASEAAGSGSVDVGSRRVSPGYGLTVLPLENVSADTVMKLVEGFGARAGTVRVDPARNLLLVQGSAPERRAMIETALAFDVDWMRGQSVGVFPLTNATPEVMIAELNRIMDAGSGGPGAGLVRFQPVSRLNAVLAISQSPKYVQQVATWVRRLDRADQENTRLRVYRVQHGDARRIAAILNTVFTGGAGAGAGTGDLAQLAPGTDSVSSAALTTQPSSEDSESGQQTSQQSRSASLFDRTSGSQGDDPTNSETGVGASSDALAAGAGATAAGATGEAVLRNVRITADVANNSLLVYADRTSWQIIERALADIDRPGLQVAIEATIVEVTLSGNLQYGVQFYLKSKDFGLPGNIGNLGLFNKSDEPPLQRSTPNFEFVLGPNNSPRAIIDALRTVTDVKVLSSPSLVVSDNQVATLQVGNEVPVTTRSAQSVQDPDAPTVNEVEYKNTGVILRVTPRVSANGTVNLEVEQEISNVLRNGTEDSLTPTISQRRVKSAVSVTNGQTVVLAGLIQEQIERTKQGIPVIMDLPVVGDFVSTQSNRSDRTELIIFIKPQIIRDSVDAQLIAEELRLKVIGGARP
jgi:general secretion pathway protein D